MANKHVNAIVVGAGAGGGVVAKELSEAGLTVVLFERGRWQDYEDHDHDELISQRITALGNAFGPDNERYRRVAQRGDKWVTVPPNEWAYNNNAACMGGGTLSYGAMAWRFMPQDFRMKSTYGELAGSTLADWPLTYEDLEPYYEKAEWEIGVSGDDSQNPFAPPRRKPQPMPPFPFNTEGRVLKAAALRLGYHPFPLPMLRNSVSYGGRPKCRRCRHCVGFACAVNAKCGTQNTVIPQALATGNCEVRTQSVVAEILFDDRGRATGVAYFDAQDQGQIQTADLVVVAGSATESARLLLNSKHRLFPQGAGNNHDWVGRNLQGHAYTGAYGLFPEVMYDDIGAGATVGLCDFNHGNEGLKGGGMLANEFIRLPYLFTDRRPPGSARWGLAHKDFQRRQFKHLTSVKGPVQEMPVFDARVEIDPVVKDHWGIPVARLSGSRHEHDVEIGHFLADKAEQLLKEAGATQTWKAPPGMGLSGGQHQAGTCRMGDDPATSVTNRYGQLHEIDNLFVADGSLHVTNGGFNPVLTIMALGYWVSDYIKKEWQSSRLRS
ncbi:MAG: GMC family oxidoreductase [Phycisphaerae bacterium]|nr:GMC family oxidoreductase [Phycisphaerae bacterium]